MPRRTLRVGYADFPPFVSKRGTRLVGFEAALWEAVARELGVASRFSRHTLSELLSRVRAGTLDVAFAGISKTEAREREVDFTHATYSSGLAILVRSVGRFRILRALGTLLVEKRRTIGESCSGSAASWPRSATPCGSSSAARGLSRRTI